MKIKKSRISLYCVILSLFVTLMILSLLSTNNIYKYNSNNDSVVQVVTQTASPDLVKVFIDDAIQISHNGANINKTIMPFNYISLSKDLFLRYTNPTYGIKIEYPYNWVIDDTNYPEGKGGVQVAAFYLPNEIDGIPFIRVGIDNLTKEFPERQGSVGIFDYLNKALESKNSKGFPGFKLIESNLITITSNNTLAGNHLTYRIMWTYTHPTYGIRKSIEVGTVIGNKGYFIDYTSNISKFSNYLQIVKKVISSLDIINNKSNHQLQVNKQIQQI
ncbi:MAG TPA: hypothetical protein VFI70_03570 [Nitrososphaeraceae archaeon]|nr:hypothetical protein [Nitrososphaeraceae archaeon]